MHHEQNFAYQELLNAATMPSQPYGSLMPTAQKGRLSMVRRVPVGVVGAITPWNSPTVLGMRVVAPALALGNAVVLKPDPQTPVAGGAIFAAVFAEAGLPDGVLQVVVGGADVGEAIVTDPAVALVSFTGSTAAGRRVGRACRRAAQAGVAQLGGNNAFVVLDDADLDAAAVGRRLRLVPVHGPGLLRGRPPHRPSERRRRLRRPLTEKARRLRLGDPYREDVELGRSSTRSSSSGSTGSSADPSRAAPGSSGRHPRGAVLPSDRPADVTADLPAWTEEIFGPVAPVVTFDTDEEAIALANDSETGSSPPSTPARSRAARPRQADPGGMVHVNDQTVNDEATSRSAGWARRATAAGSAGSELDSSPSGSG